MKILLISYGDIDFDGRLRSLINVFSEIGNVYSYTRGSAPLNEISKVSNSPYYRFIGEAVRYAKGIENVDWLVLDNRKATIPGMIIQRKCHPTVTIQDCRELYLMKEVKHFTGKAGCFFEKNMIKKADIIICANQERAEIMQKEYGLQRKPLTYENLRKLQYGSDEEIKKAKQRIDEFIKPGEYNIISSSGCSIERTNDILVENLSRVKAKCRLFLVGENSEQDEQKIRSIIKTKKIDNVSILGRLNQAELKYLISKCQIGIVNYGQYDTNNKYCASGKLYEYLYEGIPVVTTTNPPLKRLCCQYNIGVSDDEYFNGINEVLEHLNEYSENVKMFISSHTIEENDSALIKDINYAISE